jgi:hypothetical protein
MGSREKRSVPLPVRSASEWVGVDVNAKRRGDGVLIAKIPHDGETTPMHLLAQRAFTSPKRKRVNRSGRKCKVTG